jgi:hypothetical protein
MCDRFSILTASATLATVLEWIRKLKDNVVYDRVKT